MKLLIVESPGKIKKLQSFLPAEWRVAASVGHVRDLPDEGYGLEPPDFRPVYQISPDKKDVVARLRMLAGEADEVYLASDPDREGEAIAWHLKDVLGLSACKRVTYTAITKDDVEAGIATPRDIDMALVHAQEARRALDRLVGYKVSGPLSRACSERRLSAGRVQSPAVRIVVDREQEIRTFVSTTHYGVELIFDRVENVAEGWNAVWLPKEGWLDEDNPYVLDKAVADRVAAVRNLDVLAFEEKEAATAPPAPFTTSSLQQAAGNALKFTPKKTMGLAQKLYEAGHITYMRTDSPNLSETAIAEIRAYADAQGLPLPPAPRTWKSKDGAQEAHEDRIGEQMAETLQEHTALNGRALQKRMEAILRLMRIHDPADVLRKYPHQLSGGMLQRVMIGLAICMQPSLIIADEPTTAIDSISQYAIMQEFLRIKRRGEVSMIFISHDLGVLSLIADKVIVMHDGKAVESGTAQEIFDNATDTYTRHLIKQHRAVMHRFLDALHAPVPGRIPA